MTTILNNQKSDVGSPYVYYSVSLTEIQNSRTADSVQLYTEVESHLATAQSSLAIGKILRSRLYFFDGDNDYNTEDLPVQYADIDLKSSGDTWSGTTIHTQTKTITLNNLPSALTTIKNIKFRVWRADSSGTSGNMSAKDCSDFTISIGHLVPSNVQMTMAETNASLVSAGVSNDVLVENLSQKQLTFTYELHDSATMEKVGVYNRINPFSSTTNPFVLDLSTITLEKDTDDNTKIPLKPYVKDSFNTQGLGLETKYSYIAYTPILITETSTTAKRDGQVSGKVKLSVNGSLFDGVIGNVDQSAYKPTIKYKYWKVGDSEPLTYANTISSSNISVTDGEFSVSSLNIGSTTESDPNYFDPNSTYRIKVYVEDNFTNTTSNEIQIPKGIAVWSEYENFVDFVKLKIKKVELFDIQIGSTDLLYVNSNSYTDEPIVFDREFAQKPVIICNVRGDAGSADNGYTQVGVLDTSLTTTGATLRYYNGNNSSTRAMYIDWVAIGIRK